MPPTLIHRALPSLACNTLQEILPSFNCTPRRGLPTVFFCSLHNLVSDFTDAADVARPESRGLWLSASKNSVRRGRGFAGYYQEQNGPLVLVVSTLVSLTSRSQDNHRHPLYPCSA